jgi:hypothetical protein
MLPTTQFRHSELKRAMRANFLVKVLSLGFGEPLVLTSLNQEFHFGLAKELRNLELFEFLMA